MKTDRHADVLVVGAGPVGMFGVFMCGMLKLRCHLVDALDHVGGQCAALYPDKPIYDVPAFAQVSAGELVARLERQIEPFVPKLHLGHRLDDIARASDGRFRCRTSRGEALTADAVLIAAGNGLMIPVRPPIKGLAELENKSVFYSVRKKADFTDKRVVIAGGGDSAVDWAIELSESAAHVTVVHRRAQFRASPHATARMTDLASAGKLTVAKPFQLKEVQAVDGELTQVVLGGMDGGVLRLDADALLLFFGLSNAIGPIANWGLETTGGRVQVQAATMETSIPGIFAVGDIAHYPGKLQLILCGFSEAAMAAHSIHARLRPDDLHEVQHSTATGIPNLASF